MANEEKKKSIFEAARETAVAESPLGMKMQFLEYSRPHIKMVEGILIELEPQFEVSRKVGKDIFVEDNKLTPTWINFHGRKATNPFFYDEGQGDFNMATGLSDRYVGHLWEVNLDYDFILEIKLFIYQGGKPHFTTSLTKKAFSERGREYRQPTYCFRDKDGNRDWYGVAFDINKLRTLLVSAFAEYMNANKLIDVKEVDVNLDEPRIESRIVVDKTKRIVPEHITRYEVVGGFEEDVEVSCPQCNGSYGGKFAQTCPFCGVSRKVFYVRKGEEIK
ncbi:MAG: hypothetical protein WAV56_02060 [Microgenomates group bacterium]